ncbi:F-box domain-containing protein [Fusarium sp. LHS14.1]|nr:F-box domain-containing protein [Fusarium sp. LHS14.1]
MYSLNKHSRDFDHLSFAAGMIVNRLYDNQLRSFSWDLGTCIPGGIFGPEGIITSRQKSLHAICLTTDQHCGRGEVHMHPYPCLQKSVIKLENFGNLIVLRWRAPHYEDIPTLSSAITGNRGHLQNLELDFIDWGEIVGYDALGEDACPFSRAILQMPPTLSSPLFPQLRELSLSHTHIGAQLA